MTCRLQVQVQVMLMYWLHFSCIKTCHVCFDVTMHKVFACAPTALQAGAGGA